MKMMTIFCQHLRAPVRLMRQFGSIFCDHEAAFIDPGEVRTEELYGLVASTYFMGGPMIKIKAHVL